MALPLGKSCQFPFTPHDLADARQKYEHMAGRATDCLRHGGGDLFDQVTLFAAPSKPHLDWKDTALGRHDRAGRAPLPPSAEETGHRLRGQCRAHHHDPEVGPHGLPQADEKTEHEVHFDRAFVKLVEHDRPDPIQRDVAEQPPEHDAGSLDDEPRVATHTRVKPHLIAHLATEHHGAEFRDLMSYGPRCQSPRLQQDEPLTRRQVVENRRWHKHRLAGARRRGDDNGPGPRRRHDVAENLGHGQIGRQQWASG